MTVNLRCDDFHKLEIVASGDEVVGRGRAVDAAEGAEGFEDSGDVRGTACELGSGFAPNRFEVGAVGHDK